MQVSTVTGGTLLIVSTAPADTRPSAYEALTQYPWENPRGLAQDLIHERLQFDVAERDSPDVMGSFLLCNTNNPDVEGVKAVINFLVEKGLDPFAPDSHRKERNGYLLLIDHDPTHWMVDWCLDLPMAPVSVEKTRERRRKSDELLVILNDDPRPGSMSQMSSLQLANLGFLETWGDGRTTLERVIQAMLDDPNTERNKPEFECVEWQRGIGRVAEGVIRQGGGPEHLWLIWWAGWFLAGTTSATKNHRYSVATETAEEKTWQAPLRRLEQTLCKVLGGPAGRGGRRAWLWEGGKAWAQAQGPGGALGAMLPQACLHYLASQPTAEGEIDRLDRARLALDALDLVQQLVRTFPEGDLAECHKAPLRGLRAGVHRLGLLLKKDPVGYAQFLQLPGLMDEGLRAHASGTMSQDWRVILDDALGAGVAWPDNAALLQWVQENPWSELARVALDAALLGEHTRPALRVGTRGRL